MWMAEKARNPHAVPCRGRLVADHVLIDGDSWAAMRASYLTKGS